MREDCEAGHAEVRKTVEALDARIAAHRWRSLARLGVVLWDPDQRTSYQTDLPPAERKVELYYKNGHVIAKVPGISVLYDLAVDWKNPRPSEACATWPTIVSADVDTETGRTVIGLGYNWADVCTDTGGHFHRVDLPAKLLEETTKRPLDDP